MMKRRLGRSIGAAALTLVAAGAVSVSLAFAGTSVADATGASNTLRLTSVQISEKEFSGNHFVDSDKDVSKGKVIGFDVVEGVYHPKAETFTLDLAGSLQGGIIYAHGTGNGRTGKFKGSITGGTGRFKGVRGTVTGHALGDQDQNEKLVITYHH
jgi:hypothetical protein